MSQIRSSAHGEPSLTIETTTGLAIFGRTTNRVDGDFAVDAAALAARRRSVVDLPWFWARQVHGHRVITVANARDTKVCGTDADAFVTALPGVVLAIQSADCAPVSLWSPEGVIGVAHAGWRGLEAGVVAKTADAMRALGATDIEAELGPCIHAECYEFGADGIDRLTGVFGDKIRAETATGKPALDLVEVVRVATAHAGVDLFVSALDVGDECTACNAGKYFSHRARGEKQRMATVLWREAPSGGAR